MVQEVNDEAMVPSSSKPVVILGWALIIASTMGNCWLAYQVAEFRFGGGASAAQADFELFLLIIMIGGPIAVVALFLLVAITLVNLRNQRFLAAMVRKPVVLLCGINLLLPLGLLAYLLSIR